MKKAIVMAGVLFALTMTAGCGSQNQDHEQLRNHRLRTQLVDRVQLHKVRIQIRNRQMEIVQIQQKQM